MSVWLYEEFWCLVQTFFQTRWFLWKEKQWIQKCFPEFSKDEEVLDRLYCFSNPFQICRKFLQAKQAGVIHAYGETPLPVLHRLAQVWDLREKDHLVELGCGRGRGAFFLQRLTGCQITGVDWIPVFIERALTLSKIRYVHSKMTFLCQDILLVDLSMATHIYLYGSCLDDLTLSQLTHRFEQLSSFVQIATVSYPLSDYSTQFEVIATWTALFPWGEAEVYINARRYTNPQNEFLR